MDSATFVLYRAGKRLTIQEEDMSVDKICRIFQVSASSLYITDDANRAILPEAAGHFSTFNLNNRMHYEVHGEPEQSQPPASRAPPPIAAVPSFHFMHRASSSSASTSNESATSHGIPRAGAKFPAKSFHRSVHIGEIVNGKLSTSMTMAIRFSEAEANVEGITAKVQAAINSDESLTLTDSQGNEILDCEGTRSSKYWISNSRKVYAITDYDFVELQNGRRAKVSRRSQDSSKSQDSSSLEEVISNIDHLKQAAENLPDITSTINQLSELVKAKSATVAAASLHHIKDAFTCIVCQAVMEQPMFSTCCESLLGCRTCVEHWLLTSDLCLKCRQDGFASKVHQVKGLSAVLYTASAAFPEEE